MAKKNKKKGKDEAAAAETVSSVTTVARVTEIISSSPTSFQDAIELGISRACRTLQNVSGAWVQDQKIEIRDGQIHAYRVNLKVTFVLND